VRALAARIRRGACVGRTMPRRSRRAAWRLWLGHAAQTNLAVRCGGRTTSWGLNACELFQDGARGIAETCALLPHLQALPQHEGEKADEDMRLHAILALVPDRTDVELVLLIRKRLGLCELDVASRAADRSSR